MVRPVVTQAPLKVALKRRQAAERLGVSESTLLRWTREGRLAHYALEGEYRWLPADLDAFAAAARREAVRQP